MGNLPFVVRGQTHSRGQLRAYFAAGVISLLTLYVFFRLQDYGPESAIRRFHTAILQSDPVELQRVTIQSIDTQNAVKLRIQVKDWMAHGVTYQLLRMERNPDQVRAAIVYRDDEGQTWPLLWVVERSGRTWRVNADKTWTILDDALNLMPRQ